MDAEQAKALRAPFPAETVGKLPRITCKACRDTPAKSCGNHGKSKCRACGNYITSAHIHLDYIGHAALTDRLLQVDSEWSWEPLAHEQNGAPAVDGNGGMWIRLTVAGVSRIGYGHPDGKKGGDAHKETIGDALRNAAMRFGVALDLWSKEPLQTDDEPAKSEPEPPKAEDLTPIKLEVFELGKQLEWGVAELTADYAERYGDQALGLATKAQLVDYREALTAIVNLGKKEA